MPIVCAGASVPNSTVPGAANPSTAAHPGNERAPRRSNRSNLDVSLMSVTPDLEGHLIGQSLDVHSLIVSMAGAPRRRCDDRRRSPNLVAKPAVLRRPRDEADIFFDVPPRTFVLTLRLHISFCRRTRRRSFGIGCS